MTMNLYVRADEAVDDVAVAIEELLRGEADAPLSAADLRTATSLIESMLDLAHLIAESAACEIEDLLEKPHLIAAALTAANNTTVDAAPLQPQPVQPAAPVKADVTIHKGGGMGFSGAAGVDWFRFNALRSGLSLYVKTGMVPNRAWTRNTMLSMATGYTEVVYARSKKAAERALADLDAMAAKKAATLTIVEEA